MQEFNIQEFNSNVMPKHSFKNQYRQLPRPPSGQKRPPSCSNFTPDATYTPAEKKREKREEREDLTHCLSDDPLSYQCPIPTMWGLNAIIIALERGVR